MGLPVPLCVTVTPPSDEVHVTVYLTIGLPPFVGCVKVTVTEPFPGVTPRIVGGPGRVAGTEIVTWFDHGVNQGTVPISASMRYVHAVPAAQVPASAGLV